MKGHKYKFTIFTPCYNSAPFIHRVFKTLDSQTYRNFEWIVINDASTDNTAELIREYIGKVDFRVKFFDLKQNQMLAANYNLAFDNTEGEIFVVTGHDDIYMPDMLENYSLLYDKYNSEDIGGLVGRCITQFGKVTPCEFTKSIMSYFEYGIDKNGYSTGEAPRALKTEILQKYMPFDPEEKINPTIEKLMALDGYKFITTNNIVREYYVSENENALTYSASKFRYHLWKDALLDINQAQFYMHWSFKRRLRGVLDYDYSAIQYKLGFIKSTRALTHNRTEAIVLYPAAQLLYFVASNSCLHDLFLTIKSGHKPPKSK